MATETFRKNAIEILELLSSLDAQREYEKNVPTADLPAELNCIWFNDFFHPDAGFEAQFSSQEMTALQEFHHFFLDRSSRLPESSLAALHESPSWLEVVAKAKVTLEALSK